MMIRSASFAALVVSAGIANAQVTVYSNSAAPGDAFTNGGASNTGQAVGASGWYYNNVRNNGVSGINNTFARSGNGSAYLSTPQGPDNPSSKADIEFLPAATANVNGNYSAGAALGRLADLTSFGYDWYRSSVSTNDPGQHPSLRLLVVSADLTQSGALVFERIYNGFGSSMPTDTWQSDDIFANRTTYNLWSTGSLPGAFSNYSTTLQDWMSSPMNYYVVGISSGAGSGWGPFVGAVDNIAFGFNGNNTTYNFEVVPAPGAAALAGLGGLAALRRRRK